MYKLQKILIVLGICMLSANAVAQFEMPPPAVVVMEAQLTELAPSVNVPGTVYSRYDARLASELPAKIAWIAEVGTKVAEGDTVARLEDITYRLLEMEAQSRVTKEQARVTFLRSEKKRLESLAENNLSAKSQLDLTTSDLAMAESDVAIAEAQLGQAKVAMYITEIRAPFSGVVTERMRNIGERLSVADEIIRLVETRIQSRSLRVPRSTR